MESPSRGILAEICANRPPKQELSPVAKALIVRECQGWKDDINELIEGYFLYTTARNNSSRITQEFILRS
ncbi:hypothetical protein HZ326_29858 [Fusarium oxysporum f. sp. albedinis]|nr:hypothetical protein HZ326_29858 [Fusarium oxysporum f. sp. albedinis]